MTTAANTPTERARIVEIAAERLVGEFRGVHGRETIERLLDDSLDRLAAARYGDFVPVLAERFARERLLAVARSEGSITADRPTVLFLCVHNAGRSQMAAGWLIHLAGDRVDVLSGGSAPADRLNDATVAAMAEVGIDISDSFPRPWTDETVGIADVIISMGCGDACPVLPGKRYLDWDLADPAGHDVVAVRPIRDEIEQRVRGLIRELGITSD
jgi:arsenate reductase